MKFGRSLVVSIFTWILWISVKTIPTRKGLAKHAEKDYMAKDLAKTSFDEAESSVNPQIQKNKETLTKTDKDRNNGKGKVISKSEYNKEYYRKNKEKCAENDRKYREQNKEKVKENNQNYYKMNRSARIQHMKIYYDKNKETIMKRKKIYNQNNK